MIKYEIEGGNLPVVICYPEAGQTLCTESGTGIFAITVYDRKRKAVSKR